MKYPILFTACALLATSRSYAASTRNRAFFPPIFQCEFTLRKDIKDKNPEIITLLGYSEYSNQDELHAPRRRLMDETPVAAVVQHNNSTSNDPQYKLGPILVGTLQSLSDGKKQFICHADGFNFKLEFASSSRSRSILTAQYSEDGEEVISAGLGHCVFLNQ